MLAACPAATSTSWANSMPNAGPAAHAPHMVISALLLQQASLACARLAAPRRGLGGAGGVSYCHEDQLASLDAERCVSAAGAVSARPGRSPTSPAPQVVMPLLLHSWPPAHPSSSLITNAVSIASRY